MKHICIDCRMWGKKYGGIGRYTKEIVVYMLNNTNWEFILLCYDDAYTELRGYPNHNTNSLRHLRLCKAPLFSISAQLELYKNIPPCDLLWVPSINIPIFPTKAKKYITTIHDVFHLAHPEYYNRMKLAVLKLLIRQCVRRSDLILTVSDFSKNEIARFYGEKVMKKIKSVYNGFTPIDIRTIAQGETYGRYMLYVGNIKPHKNLKNALLGFEKYINKFNNDLNFIIVGKREGFVTVENEIGEIVSRINCDKEFVIFAGNVNDEQLYSLYNSASLFIQPSYYEGFGIPLVEAMSFNLPIICSDIPVFHEICKNQVGYFDPESPESICNAIAENEQRERVVYEKWQSWETTAKEIIKCLETL